jgi:uncharacterized protein
MNARARAVWASTALLVWPERYRLVSLPLARREEATALIAMAGPFAAVVVERDEVSVTASEQAWRSSPLAATGARDDGPYRAITLDVNVPLGVSGYLAPAALRLADAGVPIVPQCAFLKDHLLVREEHLERALQVLEGLIRECRLEADLQA